MTLKANLIVDVMIFAAILMADEPRLTGIALHEWLSVALAVTIIVHLLLHWKWIVQVGADYLQRLWQVSRLKFLVDALLFIAFTVVMMSGLMISRSVLPFLQITLGHNAGWNAVHSLSATMTMLLVGLHFALNWDWVVAVSKRFVVVPLQRVFGSHKAPAGVVVEVRER